MSTTNEAAPQPDAVCKCGHLFASHGVLVGEGGREGCRVCLCNLFVGAAPQPETGEGLHDGRPTCSLCGEPMPPGEEMFKFHGYSGPCPKPPLPKFLGPLLTGRATDAEVADWLADVADACEGEPNNDAWNLREAEKRLRSRPVVEAPGGTGGVAEVMALQRAVEAPADYFGLIWRRLRHVLNTWVRANEALATDADREAFNRAMSLASEAVADVAARMPKGGPRQLVQSGVEAPALSEEPWGMLLYRHGRHVAPDCDVFKSREEYGRGWETGDEKHCTCGLGLALEAAGIIDGGYVLALSASPSAEPRTTGETRHGWNVWTGVACVECPDCAFTMDADHEDTQGGYSCPNCPQPPVAPSAERVEQALRNHWPTFKAGWQIRCTCGEEYSVSHVAAHIASEIGK